MKKLVFILLPLLIGCMSLSATPRFFKANSVRIRYNIYPDPIAICPDPIVKNLDDYFTYHQTWLGNDTIVDGYPCVAIWDQADTENEPICTGFIREDDEGYVWKYILTDRYLDFDNNLCEEFGVLKKWVFLYDFSSSNTWQIKSYFKTLDLNKLPNFSIMEKRCINIKDVVLLTGETVRCANGWLCYGLGNIEYPFGLESGFENLRGNCGQVLEYWRDGVLIYQDKDINGINLKEAESQFPCYFNLQGHPVVNLTRGIYIRDGRKVLVK